MAADRPHRIFSEPDIAGRGGGCRNWADSAPSEVASGRTGVHAVTVIPLRARNRLYRPFATSPHGREALEILIASAATKRKSFAGSLEDCFSKPTLTSGQLQFHVEIRRRRLSPGVTGVQNGGATSRPARSARRPHNSDLPRPRCGGRGLAPPRRAVARSTPCR